MIGLDKKYKDKRYFIQIKVKDPMTGKYKSKMKRGFKTKTEAKMAETDLMRENNNTSLTFHQMSDLYADQTDSQETNREILKSVYKNHCQMFYETEFKDIGKPELNIWHTSIKNSDLALKTKNRIITTVKSVFTYAADIHDLPNPSKCLKQLKGTSDDVEEKMHVWTVEEFNAFISKVPEGYYRNFYFTLYWTGMRRGECLALQCSDLDDNGYLHITKSIKHFKNGFTPLKNKGSKRLIKLDDNTLKIVKQTIQQSGNDGFIFGKERSLPISNVQREFTKGIEASGVPKIRLHDLRHSHATLLINNGVNIVAVSKRLGHSSVAITLKVYTHLFQKTDDEMMITIQKLAQNGGIMVAGKEKTA